MENEKWKMENEKWKIASVKLILGFSRHTHRLVIGFGDILPRGEFSIAHIALLPMSPLSLRVNRSQFIVKNYSVGFKKCYINQH